MLYKIATNASLDLLRRRPRRTLPESAFPPGDPARPAAPPSSEPVWLEPFPDDLLAAPDDLPDVRYDARESIRLAFLAALQALTPRQRAVLILRDVLGFRAREVVSLLGLTLPTVNSILHQACATLAMRYRPGPETTPRRPGSGRQAALLDRYVKAWEASDVQGLIGLLKEDAILSMPPSPSWFRGREAIRRFTAAEIFTPPNVWRLAPTRANGQPAYVLRRRTGGGSDTPFGIQVLTLTGSRVARIDTFLNADLVLRFSVGRDRMPGK